jgi:hypothetical protein
MKLCLNCGQELRGPFCYGCGQRDQPRVIPLRRIIRDAIGEAFSVDGRLVNSLRLLFRRPGFLTNEYVAGRRAAYLPPFRIYLLVSVVYFLILALTGFDTFFFAMASPQSIAARYMRLLPKVMFVILPAFALLLKLLYPRRLYVEHLVASLHLHSITFILLSVHTLIINYWSIVPVWPRLALFILIDLPVQLAVFVYFFLTLRSVYGNSRWLTFVKMFALVIGYLALLTLIGATIINGSRILDAATTN